MDFEWTDDHKAFRRRIRAVLDKHLPANWPELTHFDNSSETVSQFALNFAPILASEGLLIPHWPKAVGGEGLDAFHHWILGEEMWSNGEPRAYQYMNVNWVGPAILKFGRQDQIDAFVPRICAGTTSFCQGFSEPEAGSDLASLQTRATETDTGYIINGQKIWISNASFADTCVLLARTGEGRAAITVFLVPMDSPGIEVRIIPCLLGSRSLHEVFFQDVEVPRSAVLGPPNEGWNVTRQILANERMGVPRYSLAWRGFNRALERMRQDGRLNDGYVKGRAARTEAQLRAARLLALRNVDMRVKDIDMGANTSVARFAQSHAERVVCEFLTDVCPDLLFFDVDPVIAGAHKRTQLAGIGAGAAEIQLNLIARDYLNLPKGR